MLCALPKITADSHARAMLQEAHLRFQQMHYLFNFAISSAVAANYHVNNAFRNALPGAVEGVSIDLYSHRDNPLVVAAWDMHCELTNHAILHTEMFYIIAFRQITITRYMNKRVFGRERIVREPAGVRDARNKLILHPEEVIGAPLLSRGVTIAADGVTLRSGRRPEENQDYADAGFTKNVAEFKSFWLCWWMKTYNHLSENDSRPP